MRNGVQPELFHQFGNTPQLALLTVLVKGLIQTVGDLLRFDLQQDLTDQGKLFAIHALDFLVQHWLQLFRLNGHRL
jgi:hypothetical protein